MDVRALVLVLYIGRDGLLPMQSVIPSSLFFHDLRPPGRKWSLSWRANV